ncbi:SDR family NAD(P)-dependent oxidoreductase [Salipiger sp. PrR002]|uniref:SDR family NAD(P)-dependent oxidoreductase n=1 Tax=Salipiger sp. PrR002 TaxID=2706489 RepID=UPI0013BE2F59|nr:SDR family oxidoreductase [Salipiger sp. PrR002]NDW01247.1 SDR family oxidoreductase [Salipiger sp. PrR002]NDW58109.1 SDR family oxidoreductase [Salipiger sp. PrR004]
MSGPLTGEVALVTGGSRGIGRAMALALREAGAAVAVCHPRDPQAADLPQDILQLPADVTLETEVSDMFASLQARLGPVTRVFANAGILDEAPLRETSAEAFDRVIAVNLRGAFLTARAAARQMQGGRIIFTASDLGYLGAANTVAYAASKGGIIAMTRSLARELGPQILVNAIAPGPVETDMTAGMTPEAVARDLATPLGRFGTPEEIAAMAVFLAGPGAGFITGQVYGVNGGSAMY